MGEIPTDSSATQLEDVISTQSDSNIKDSSDEGREQGSETSAFVFGQQEIHVKSMSSYHGYLIDKEKNVDLTGIMIWPGSHHLCSFLASDKIRPALKDAKVIELGCGTGLPGLLAASLGAHVVLTDQEESALTLAQQNIKLNVLQNTCWTWQLGWGDAECLRGSLRGSDRFSEKANALPISSTSSPAAILTEGGADFLLGADVIYPTTSNEVLLKLFRTVCFFARKREETRQDRTKGGINPAYFICSYVQRERRTTQRLIETSFQCGLEAKCIPWSSFSSSPPIMGAVIFLFAPSEANYTLEMAQGAAEEVFPGLYYESDGEEEEFTMPFAEEDDL